MWFFIFLFKYSVFAVMESQFGYAGIESIWISVLLFLIFLALPFEKLPFQVLVAVKWLAKYTLGVFCIHYSVGRLFTIWLSENVMKARTFSQSIVIWIISYALSFIISKNMQAACSIVYIDTWIHLRFGDLQGRWQNVYYHICSIKQDISYHFKRSYW